MRGENGVPVENPSPLRHLDTLRLRRHPYSLNLLFSRLNLMVMLLTFSGPKVPHQYLIQIESSQIFYLVSYFVDCCLLLEQIFIYLPLICPQYFFPFSLSLTLFSLTHSLPSSACLSLSISQSVSISLTPLHYF